MPFETDSTPRRSLGPAVASAVVGSSLPSNNVDANDAVLGSVQYGERR